ncbi:MAG TPA: isocitrate lyase/phosphoenolpyruvate mutase family protein [Gemmataceae bacterium]|nr:isocitrate lyase/phosphoenolpyruvate mutase family protein [Gemmataceae bacterium]
MNHETTTLAATFRKLHHSEDPLILANVWDAGTARLIARLGARAIATTSAGVAWSHGYPDGDRLPVRLLLATITRIAESISIPLTVDIEGGYSSDLTAVGEAVASVLDAGAVGINIEDGTGTPDLLCAKIERAKQAAARHGVDLFVNARTDVYLRQLTPEAGRLDEVFRRAERYRAAGADGLFVPGVVVPSDIAALCTGVGLPLNVLAWPGLPAVAELKRLGVRRFSAGSTLAQILYGRAKAFATALLTGGDWSTFDGERLTYAEINDLMA